MEAVLHCRCPHLLRVPVPVPIRCTASVARNFQQVPGPQNILVAWGPLGSLVLPSSHHLLQASGRREASLSSCHKLACAHLLHEGCVCHCVGELERGGALNLPTETSAALPAKSQQDYCQIGLFQKGVAEPIFDASLLLCAFLLSLVRNYADVVLPKSTVCEENICSLYICYPSFVFRKI